MISQKKVVDQLFLEVTNNSQYPKCSFSNKSYSVDVFQDEKKYVLFVELPGCNHSDIVVSYSDDYLMISATKNAFDKAGLELLRGEICYGPFSRSFYITGINPDNIRAQYEKGILRVEIEKLKN